MNQPYILAIVFLVIFSAALMGYLFTFNTQVSIDEYSYSSAGSSLLDTPKPSLWTQVKDEAEKQSLKWTDMKSTTLNDPKLVKNLVMCMSTMAVTSNNTASSPTQMPFELTELMDMTYILGIELENKVLQTNKLFYFPPPPELPYKLTAIAKNRRSATIDGRMYVPKQKLGESGYTIIEIQADKVILQDEKGKKVALKITPKK